MASPFSGKAGRNAAVWTAKFLGDTQEKLGKVIDAGATGAQQAISTGVSGARSDINAGYKNARSDIRTGNNAATKALNTGLKTSLSELDVGVGKSIDAIDQGFGAARTSVQQGIDLFDPYAEGGTKAFNRYLDALGVNGADGATRAQENFHTGPGYRFQVDEATDAAARKMAALGLTGSGNTLDAITRIGSGLADQEWGDHLARLKGAGDTGLQALDQQQEGYTNLADLDSRAGERRADIHTNAATGRANLTYQNGSNLAEINTNEGTRLSELSTGKATTLADLGFRGGAAQAGLSTDHAKTIADLGLNISSQVAGAGQKGFTAGQDAAANRFNFGMQGLQLVTGLAGKAFGKAA